MRRCKLALGPSSSQPSSELDFGRWRCARTAHLQRRATWKPRRHTTRASPRVVISTHAREPTPSPPPRHLGHPGTLKLSSSQPRSNFDFGRLRCAPTSKVGLTRVHLQRRAAWDTRIHHLHRHAATDPHPHPHAHPGTQAFVTVNALATTPGPLYAVSRTGGWKEKVL